VPEALSQQNLPGNIARTVVIDVIQLPLNDSGDHQHVCGGLARIDRDADIANALSD